MTDKFDDLTLPEEEAFTLTEAAVLLDRARMADERAKAVVSALNHNLEMWVTIRTRARNTVNPLPDALRDNLLRLSDFVAQTTFREGASISEDSLNALININLQLAEGLLEGQKAAASHAAA